MKVGVLGAGAMGNFVAEQAKQCEGVDEVIAYDVNEEHVRQIQEQHAIRATTQLEEVLNDSTVRLVFVTAANHAHKDLTVRALQAGKAVMCEKPMATTLADARAMVETAEQRGGFLQIGFELRYSKLYTKIKEWTDAGLLGQVINTHCIYISSAWEKGLWRTRKSSGGSMFGEKLSHYVDLPRWWIGAEVKNVSSICAPNVVPYLEVHDNYHTAYRFKNGAVSHLTFMMGPAATFYGDPIQNVPELQKGDGHALRYLVVGTQGAAEADAINRSIKRWEFGDSPTCFTNAWMENLTWDPSEDHFYIHNVIDQTKDIVRRVLAGSPPMTPARDAYETMKVCFAAEESADRGVIVEMQDMGSLS